MGYAALGALFMFVIIFIIVWYVAELCSVLGIVFGCISCSNSKKYVNTRGMGNFKSVKNYRTAATVFMVISCIVIALWLVFWIWFEISLKQYRDIEIEEDAYAVITEFFASSITMMAVHIGSVVAGIVAQVQYKKAKELNEDIRSGKVAPPPPPVVMMPVYPANPYQQNGYYQNGYNGQPNNPYQQNNGYYNQPNPYGQNPQQAPYNPNPQGYQPPPQNNPNYGQGYQNPPAGGGFVSGQQNPQPQFPDPTVNAPSVSNNSVFNTVKTVTCPNCGKDNTDNSKFCANCGHIMK